MLGSDYFVSFAVIVVATATIGSAFEFIADATFRA